MMSKKGPPSTGIQRIPLCQERVQVEALLRFSAGRMLRPREVKEAASALTPS